MPQDIVDYVDSKGIPQVSTMSLNQCSSDFSLVFSVFLLLVSVAFGYDNVNQTRKVSSLQLLKQCADSGKF